MINYLIAYRNCRKWFNNWWVVLLYALIVIAIILLWGVGDGGSVSQGTGRHRSRCTPSAGQRKVRLLTIRQPLFEKIASAIYIAEGGKRAKVPYGILSMPVRNKAHAREICLRSIENNYRRWDGKGDFVSYMGRRWVGIEYDPQGYVNWVANVRYLTRR